MLFEDRKSLIEVLNHGEVHEVAGKKVRFNLLGLTRAASFLELPYLLGLFSKIS